ncbi:hypothetical protein AB0436_30185 [Streptomyces sp. NPDC051322]|uniref:hypothetical protein n=1 Tax=Streptomyces sp. NPDC051322 TaxID=3154645 RepID=UPI00344D6AA1
MADDMVERLHEALRRTREFTAGRLATGLSHEGADDTVGTIGTDDAHGFDPLPLLRSLHEAGARVVVIGQVAGILHGSTELTGDLDLLWDGDPVQAQLLTAAFRAVGARLSDGAGASVPLGPDAFLRPKVQFASPGASGDCCTPALPWGSLAVADFLDRAQTVADPGGFEVHYVRRADLIRMRRAVGRPKDLRRAEELERL